MKRTTPLGWQERKLGDVCIFLDEHRVPVKESDRAMRKGIFPYYGASGVIDYIDGYIFDGEYILLGEDGENIISRKLPLAFIARGKFWVNNHAHIIKPDSDIDLKFLCDFLEQLDYRKYNSGSAQPKIIKEICRNIKIIVPPIEEQKKIAEILSTWDRAIEKLDKLIGAKTRLKKGLMQKLLTGKVRFKEFKSQWTNKQIKDLGKVVSGGTPDTGNPCYWNGKINWCTPTDITALNGQKYLGTTNRCISESGFKNSSATFLPRYSVVVCTRATLGACAINTEPMTTNQGFKSIIPQKIDYEFLYYLMSSKKHLLERLGSGSTFLEVSKADFENIDVFLPSEESEQKKIANLLSSVDHELEYLTSIQDRLKSQKQGLMQKLLTGKIRVKG